MSKRERNLEEFSIALTGGGLAAIVLCLVLPGIESKADILALLPIFWFMATIAVWTGIDIHDRKHRASATERDLLDWFFHQREE